MFNSSSIFPCLIAATSQLCHITALPYRAALPMQLSAVYRPALHAQQLLMRSTISWALPRRPDGSNAECPHALSNSFLHLLPCTARLRFSKVILLSCCCWAATLSSFLWIGTTAVTYCRHALPYEEPAVQEDMQALRDVVTAISPAKYIRAETTLVNNQYGGGVTLELFCCRRHLLYSSKACKPQKLVHSLGNVR